VLDHLVLNRNNWPRKGDMDLRMVMEMRREANKQDQLTRAATTKCSNRHPQVNIGSAIFNITHRNGITNLRSPNPVRGKACMMISHLSSKTELVGIFLSNPH
jgi:hypothetical protein